METQTIEQTETEPYEFTLADRCDRCGAEAKIRAVFKNGDLFFCGHHGNKYAATLAGAQSVEGKHL